MRKLKNLIRSMAKTLAGASAAYAALALTIQPVLAGLPPTTLKGQGGSSVTTFNFQTPPNQSTQISGVTSLIETGNRNRLKNPGFEGGTTSWTASAGTFTTTSTAADLESGALTGSWDSAASADTLTSTSLTVTGEDGLSGANVAASCRFKCDTGTCTHEIQIWDGTNILSEQTITSSTSGFVRTSITAPAPSSGTVALRIYSNADEPNLYIDDCYLGLAEGFNLSQVSQATLVGGLTVSGCSPGAWETSSTSWTAFTAQTGCTYSAFGSVSAPSTMIPGIKVSSLSPGEYTLVYDGAWGNTTADKVAYIRISDGTNTWREVPSHAVNAASGYTSTFTSSYLYTAAQSNVTLQVQAYTSSGGAVRVYGSTAQTGTFKLYRFPTSSEQAYRPDLVNRWGSVKYTGASSCVWSGTSGSFANFSADSDCGTAVGTGSGSAPATKVPGGTFSNIPAGSYLAIVNGTFVTAYSGSTTNCEWRLSDGTNHGPGVNSDASSSYNSIHSTLAGVFTYSAFQSSVTIQVQQKTSSGGGSCQVSANVASDRDFEITLIPLSQTTAAPLLTGSVTSNSSGLERVESAEINCDASSAITSQSGTWLTAVGNRSGAGCALTIAGGIFSTLRACEVTVKAATVQATSASIASATSATIYGASADYDAYVTCKGAR